MLLNRIQIGHQECLQVVIYQHASLTYQFSLTVHLVSTCSAGFLNKENLSQKFPLPETCSEKFSDVFWITAPRIRSLNSVAVGKRGAYRRDHRIQRLIDFRLFQKTGHGSVALAYCTPYCRPTSCKKFSKKNVWKKIGTSAFSRPTRRKLAESKELKTN